METGQSKVLNRRIEISALRRNGEEFPIELSILPLKEDDSYHFTAFIADITERKRAEEELRIAAIAFDSQLGMTITNAQNVILRVNKAFSEITGYTAEEVIGKTPSLLGSGRHEPAFYAAMWDSIKRTGGWQGEVWDRRKNGTVYPQLLSISSVRNEADVLTHYVGTFSDASAAKAAAEQIESLAFSDLLTGLPNRRMLIIALQQAMIAGERERRQGALLLVDLDNFRNLNDALGHEMGDRLLQQFAARLSACLREGETVSRLGGDEFVVLLEQLDQNPLEAAMDAEMAGNKILAALRHPYELDGVEISCGASIGIALFGEQHEDTVEPLKRAELAMYEAKAHGRNTLRFFDPRMQTSVNSRIAMEAGLREAIERNHFVLHYQAQVTEQGRVIGAEALLRWLDPRRGMVSPAEFIPLAEETGLILQVGHWVLESACRQLAKWATQPALAQLTLAVNVSAKQFHQRDFVDQVLSTLHRTGAKPDRLKLEMTESLLLAHVEDVIAKMNALKGGGVTFSLDDFGTGYSSLSYLKRLPLDQLKIDQGFVREILSDPNDAAIAKMVIALADSMGLSVIAEGVETEAQRDFLSALGCHHYQGYLFSRPLPIQEFEAFVERI
jgi:diguanylate cyclase (GGDEF)-like protein/PAS domain S-box-containing protein